jgi:nucleotide-binding universal stress UspA family protein
MYDRILVPLDGSVLAEAALPHAEELAGRLGSELRLVFVTKTPEDRCRRMHQLYVVGMVEVTRQGAQRYAMKSGRPSIQVKSDILVGQPTEQIVEYADKEDIGLIVMAAYRQPITWHWPSRSVAEQVLRAMQRPVLLIPAKVARPNGHEASMINRVLVPLDGSEESETVIPYVEELAYRLEAEVVLLRVLRPGYISTGAEGYEYTVFSEKQVTLDTLHAKDYLDRVGTHLNQTGVITKTEVRVGNPAEQIIKLAAWVQSNMVAMSTYGRSGVGHWIFGSVAERVLYEGNTPLLLVRI